MSFRGARGDRIEARCQVGSGGWSVNSVGRGHSTSAATQHPPTPHSIPLPGILFVLPDHSHTECPMAKCEVCGNDYEMSFQVVTAGVTHTFDSFECAIHKLAPICSHCGCKIIGHGIEANGTFYCCAHCAHAEGAKSIVDNAEHAG